MPHLLSYWAERLQFSLRQRGIRGTAIKVLQAAKRQLSPSGLEERRFDQRHGVDTAGRIGQYELDVHTGSVLWAVEYRPTPIKEFYEIVENMHLDYSQWTFVDLGSGKGRALLLATRYPFRQIVGVEYSEILTEIARKNVTAYSPPDRRCYSVDLVCMDAAEFQLPDTKVIVYLNNPFHGDVMKRVVDNVGHRPRSSGELYIIYWNPFCAEMFNSSGSLEVIGEGAGYKLYHWSAVTNTAGNRSESIARECQLPS